MKEIYRNKYLNYSFILALTLFLIIIVVNILMGKFTKLTSNIDLQPISIQIVLLIIVFATYITLIAPSARMIAQNNVLLKTPPRGDKGPRGNRGSSGDNGACSVCSDDICYNKLMYNITNTINFWRQKTGQKLLPESYVINNNFIKDKVKKHCDSKQFKKILNKYGSNNKGQKCPTGLTQGCGAYDYMFKMWNIWILIILRYKNGMYFLESDGLDENDFYGLIEKADGFKISSKPTVKKKDGTTHTISNNDNFPYLTITPTDGSKSEDIHVSKLEDINNYTWTTDLFTGSPSDGNADIHLKKASPIKKDIDTNLKTKYTFQTTDKTDIIKQSFFDDFKNKDPTKYVPGGGALSPFDEIKQYSAWYWGSDKATEPRIKLNLKTNPKICDTCPQSCLCEGSSNGNPKCVGGIKYKITNVHKKLVDTNIFDNNHVTTDNENTDNENTDDKNINITPFSKYTGISSTDPVSFYRPQTFVDHDEHPYFREYKPLGDLLFTNDHYTEKKTKPSPTSLDTFNNNSTATILVSGDIKPPKSYTLVGEPYNKSSGINTQETISIWKPEPITGYVALGYVIDMRPFKTDETSKQPMPPLDIVATIPETAVPELIKALEFSEYNRMGFYKSNIHTFLISPPTILPRYTKIIEHNCAHHSMFPINNAKMCNEAAAELDLTLDPTEIIKEDKNDYPRPEGCYLFKGTTLVLATHPDHTNNGAETSGSGSLEEETRYPICYNYIPNLCENQVMKYVNPTSPKLSAANNTSWDNKYTIQRLLNKNGSTSTDDMMDEIMNYNFTKKV